MRSYTVHLRLGEAPVLVPEAFSWGAAVFGPFWLFARGAPLAGVLVLAADFGLLVVPGAAAGVMLTGLAWALGLFGHDLRRWSLERRGYTLEGVIRAPGAEAALARLLTERRELATEALA